MHCQAMQRLVGDEAGKNFDFEFEYGNSVDDRKLFERKDGALGTSHVDESTRRNGKECNRRQKSSSGVGPHRESK